MARLYNDTQNAERQPLAGAAPRTPRFRVGTLALAFVAIATTARAADYWVSPSGNNAATGLSAATAWATLVHAAGEVGAGDTVHVQPGNYQGFYLDASGAPGNPIAFVATGPGVAITADNPVTPDGINIEGADHVVIDGFTVTGRTRAGIRAALSDFVTIRNCTAGDNGRWGIFTGFTDDLLVENNETYGSVLEHGIYVSNSCDRPVVRGNHVHDNFANGIHLNGDESQGGDGWIEDALIEGNVIHGNGTGGGSGINGDGLIDSVIRNNLLYDNHASGISLYRIDGATGATGNVVVNNTILNAANARWCINIDNGSTDNTLRNNILYNEHSFRGVITIDSSSRPGFSSDYNSVMSRFSSDGGNTVIGLAAWQALGYDANSFLATPAALFVSPSLDFHLPTTSPAVDSGTSTHAPSDDLDGAPRPVGAGYDVGCYEAQLLECGDGDVDAGEQCESDGDCAAGQSCQGCACLNGATCGSGIQLTKPSLKLTADPLRMKARGDLVVPFPWIAVDPSVNGVSIVADHLFESPRFDLAVPGGLGWTVSTDGKKWRYSDKAGSANGVTAILVRDLSAKAAGLIRWSIKAEGAPAVLPSLDAVRLTALVGGAGECAETVFSGPTGTKPRCTGASERISCR